MSFRDPIQHVVLLMLENHSFDQMLGSLQVVYPQLDGIDIGAATPRMNTDKQGKPYYQIPTDATQERKDPNHETVNVLEQLQGPNEGFVTNFQQVVRCTKPQDRQLIMSYYPLGFLPALHALAQEFTVCDHWFSSLPGPTWPNRFFALSGTSSGRVTMPEMPLHPHLGTIAAQTQFTVFDRLNEQGKSWRIYYYDFPSSLLLARQRRAENLIHYERIDRFFTDARQAETFPDFVFIEPKYFGLDQNDDHPPHNIFKAEKLIADVYNALRSNAALWETTLLVVVFDEHGGFYDHVPPPTAVPPDEHQEEYAFDRLGVRVRALLVSPWVKAGVESTQFDHTSLLRYLTDKWQLGALGARTAVTNSIAVAINQRTPRQGTVPFIRVSNTSLIPDDPDLEADDVSIHHDALHTFADWLHQAEGEAATAIPETLVARARLWERLLAWVGRLLRHIGRWLEGPLKSKRAARVAATSEAAHTLIERARAATVGPSAP